MQSHGGDAFPKCEVELKYTRGECIAMERIYKKEGDMISNSLRFALEMRRSDIFAKRYHLSYFKWSCSHSREHIYFLSNKQPTNKQLLFGSRSLIESRDFLMEIGVDGEGKR